MTANSGTHEALINKRLIYNASLIIDDPRRFTLDRFFDLCSLCEAVVLFDNLKALDSADTLPVFGLSTSLDSSAILEVFTPSFTPEDYRRLCTFFLDNTLDPPMPAKWANLPEVPEPGYRMRPPRQFWIRGGGTFWERGEAPEMISRQRNRYRALEERGESQDRAYSVDDIRPMARITKDRNSAPHSYYDEGGNVPDPRLLSFPESAITSLANGDSTELLAWTDFFATLPSVTDDDIALEAYILRSMGYLLVAAAAGLDYFPDFLRVPYIASYADRLYKSLPRELYARIVASLGTDIDAINSTQRSFTLPIPPIAALVMDRSRSLEDIPQSLLQLRQEFSPARQYFADLRQSIWEANSLNERKRVLNKYSRLLKQVSGNQAEAISGKEVLNFAGDAVKAIAHPSDPTSYSSSLISQPLEWIRRWWIRRPIAVFFRVDKKVRRFPEYDRLIRKLWGHGAEDAVQWAFGQYAPVIDNLFRQSTRKGPSTRATPS